MLIFARSSTKDACSGSVNSRGPSALRRRVLTAASFASVALTQYRVGPGRHSGRIEVSLDDFGLLSRTSEVATRQNDFARMWLHAQMIVLAKLAVQVLLSVLCD